MVGFPNKTSQIFNSPCTTIKDEEFNELIAQKDIEFSYFGKGTDSCDGYIKSLTDVESCNGIFKECFDFGLSSQSLENDETFVAFSSYQWEFWRFMNTKNETLKLTEVKANIQKICSGNHDFEFSSETDCFEVSYILNMLENIYGFKVF